MECLFCKDKIKTSYHTAMAGGLFAHNMCYADWMARKSESKPKPPRKRKAKLLKRLPKAKTYKLANYRKKKVCRVCGEQIRRKRQGPVNVHPICQPQRAREYTASDNEGAKT